MIGDALRKQGMNKLKADEDLADLEHEQTLLSDPTRTSLDVRFPMLVVEGEGYATGANGFGAENQAAMARSCMINLLRQLTDLQKETSPDAQPEGMGPFAFSFCTQGPWLGFWVHHTVEEESITEYHMNLLMACHTSFVAEVQRLLLLVEQVMSWYGNEFLDGVADQLVDLSRRPLTG
ncbi:hypothetical protein CLAIMM_05733 [Cladophialophora immunda]|nr:hypothetical protein CLAIMM_05733 [Cladophialophora immunda]